MIRVLLLFCFLSVVFSQCDLDALCTCDTRRGNGETLCQGDCCDINLATEQEKTISFKTPRGTPVNVECLCCTCSNVSCSNSLQLTVETQISGESFAQHFFHHKKPTVEVADEEDSVETVETVETAEIVETSKPTTRQTTVADFHRELLDGRMEIRGCSDLDEVCNCGSDDEGVHCFLDCCETPDERREPKMMMPTERGETILVDCDCCSCRDVDCSYDIEIEED